MPFFKSQIENILKMFDIWYIKNFHCTNLKLGVTPKQVLDIYFLLAYPQLPLLKLGALYIKQILVFNGMNY